MSNRTLRVNELILRELSAILRKRYQSESVALTLTEVRVSPDLHEGRVFVSVVGDETMLEQKLRWLRAHARELREELGRTIVLKHMPRFEFVPDHSMEQGTRILRVLDEIAAQPPSIQPAPEVNPEKGA